MRCFRSFNTPLKLAGIFGLILVFALSAVEATLQSTSSSGRATVVKGGKGGFFLKNGRDKKPQNSR